jgi:hypothetical protein
VRRAALLIALVAVLPLPLMAGTLRVRLWWQHPPPAIRAVGNAGADWRTCPTCRSQNLQSLEVKAEGRILRLGGTSTNLVLLRGSYDVTVPGTTVHLTGPTEIR